jgi:hypothetical protein
VAHFKYFAHCERCKWSEAIMLNMISDPWPRCEVCGDHMAVFAIGCSDADPAGCRSRSRGG